MEITSIKVFPVEEERLKAFATIVFDSCFVVRDLKIIKGNKGLFVAMPSKRCKDGTFKDMAHPLNSEMRSLIEDQVIDEYNREKEHPSSSVGATALGEATDLDGQPVDDAEPTNPTLDAATP